MKDELRVSLKTLKRYIGEAYYALITLGYSVYSHPLKNIYKLVKTCVFEGSDEKQRCVSRSYWSISWCDILRWEEELRPLTYLDTIPFSILTLAFTTLRRVGSFLPASKKKLLNFPWILPRYVRRMNPDTVLI